MRYIVIVVDDGHGALSGCEQLGLDVEAEFFRFVGDLHAGPPDVPVVELKEQGSVADVEVYHLVVLVAFPDDLGHEVDCFVHLQSDFGLDAHLAVFVRAPAIESAVVHQSH
jgi:hypothetical protein